MQGPPPPRGYARVTMALAALIVATCVIQSIVGWNQVVASFGFIPAATWSLSDWLSRLPGQSLPVVLTWLAYFLPHTGWIHMAGTVFGITLFGWGVEREYGTRKYALVVLFLLVSGVFVLSAIHPRGNEPMAGGSLLGFGLMGFWFAIFYRIKWQKFPRATIALEVAVAAAVICWLAIRTIPSEPSLFLAVMWHAVPLMVGWFGHRAAVAWRFV